LIEKESKSKGGEPKVSNAYVIAAFGTAIVLVMALLANLVHDIRAENKRNRLIANMDSSLHQRLDENTNRINLIEDWARGWKQQLLEYDWGGNLKSEPVKPQKKVRQSTKA
jgi:hypothetical protein